MSSTLGSTPRLEKRSRPEDPSTIRDWVAGKSPARIYALIAEKIGVLTDTVIGPYGSALRELNRRVLPPPAPGTEAALEQLLDRSVLRGPCNLISRYYHYRLKPYRPGRWLPRIVVDSFPWDVGPGEISWLDLEPDWRLALERRSGRASWQPFSEHPPRRVFGPGGLLRFLPLRDAARRFAGVETMPARRPVSEVNRVKGLGLGFNSCIR